MQWRGGAGAPTYTQSALRFIVEGSGAYTAVEGEKTVMQPGDFGTQPYRSSDSTIFISVEGRGEIRVGAERFEMAPHDIVVVPGWMTSTLHAGDEFVLFSYSDRVAQEKLGFFREQRF